MASRQSSTRSRAAQLLGGLRVLLVEDEPDGREAIKAVLQSYGAQVTEAASVAEALAAFEQAVPDVLVSDVGLPGRDGYELMREIRKRPAERGGRVAALALTGYAEAEHRRQTASAGFQAHLNKPVSAAALLASVAALVGRTA
jgi:CheY-like chemotaxis protein